MMAANSDNEDRARSMLIEDIKKILKRHPDGLTSGKLFQEYHAQSGFELPLDMLYLDADCPPADLIEALKALPDHFKVDGAPGSELVTVVPTNDGQYSSMTYFAESEINKLYANEHGIYTLCFKQPEKKPLTMEDVHQLFGQHGRVVDVNFDKGMVFVRYDDRKACERALRKHGARFTIRAGKRRPGDEPRSSNPTSIGNGRQCYNCNEFGHLARFCPEPRKNNFVPNFRSGPPAPTRSAAKAKNAADGAESDDSWESADEASDKFRGQGKPVPFARPAGAASFRPAGVDIGQTNRHSELELTVQNLPPKYANAKEVVSLFKEKDVKLNESDIKFSSREPGFAAVKLSKVPDVLRACKAMAGLTLDGTKIVVKPIDYKLQEICKAQINELMRSKKLAEPTADQGAFASSENQIGHAVNRKERLDQFKPQSSLPQQPQVRSPPNTHNIRAINRGGVDSAITSPAVDHSFALPRQGLPAQQCNDHSNYVSAHGVQDRGFVGNVLRGTNNPLPKMVPLKNDHSASVKSRGNTSSIQESRCVHASTPCPLFPSDCQFFARECPFQHPSCASGPNCQNNACRYLHPKDNAIRAHCVLCAAESRKNETHSRQQISYVVSPQKKLVLQQTSFPDSTLRQNADRLVASRDQRNDQRFATPSYASGDRAGCPGGNKLSGDAACMHSTTRCRDFPHCPRLDACCYEHPVCSYDGRCRKDLCQLHHLSRRVGRSCFLCEKYNREMQMNSGRTPRNLQY